MIQWLVRNYLRKPTKQELDIALWQSQLVPAKARKLTPTGIKTKKNETSSVGLQRNFRHNASIHKSVSANSLRLLVLEVLVDGLEVLVEEACIVVPGDTAAEEVA